MLDAPATDDINLDIVAETLTGDLRDLILNRLQHEQDKRPWRDRSEHDQRATIHEVQRAVSEWVRQAVELIAASGRRTIRAKLEQVVVKDGIKGTVVMSAHDPLRHALVDSQGRSILIVVADPEEFEGERAPAEVKPDQAELHDAMVEHSEGPFH